MDKKKRFRNIFDKELSLVFVPIIISLCVIAMCWVYGYELAWAVTLFNLVLTGWQITLFRSLQEEKRQNALWKKYYIESVTEREKQTVTEFAERLQDYARQVKENGYDGIGENDIEEKLKEFLKNGR